LNIAYYCVVLTVYLIWNWKFLTEKKFNRKIG